MVCNDGWVGPLQILQECFKAVWEILWMCHLPLREKKWVDLVAQEKTIVVKEDGYMTNPVTVHTPPQYELCTINFSVASKCCSRYKVMKYCSVHHWSHSSPHTQNLDH
jgi:hypothetical protein